MYWVDGVVPIDVLVKDLFSWSSQSKGLRSKAACGPRVMTSISSPEPEHPGTLPIVVYGIILTVKVSIELNV